MRSNKFLFPILFLIIVFNSVTFCQKRYFYTNKDYGNEALLNPLTLLLNGGYDITQLQSVSNKIENPYFGRMLKNMLSNLGDPFPPHKKIWHLEIFQAGIAPPGFYW